MKTRRLLCLLSYLVCAVTCAASQPNPVILDTDIGTDIDDAYALAVVLHRSDLELLGVTTVSSDTAARARLAAKLLQTAGPKFANIPVYAGMATATQYMKQVEWAKGYSSASLHSSGAVEYIRNQVKQRPGKVTLIAVGELTNIAAVLNSEPNIGKLIRGIALMGGGVHRGYEPGSAPEPEWNIKSNIAAARTVFASGVPLYIAPLDSTADLKLDAARREQIFADGTPLNDALAALDFIWTDTNTWKASAPTLFDVLAVELVGDKPLCPLTPMHLEISDDGVTRAVSEQAPNANVALRCDTAFVLNEFVHRLAPE
jgi:inosine-uridine nucleoside N-ribohydrolase